MTASRLVLPMSCELLDQPPSREVREGIERSNSAVVAFLLQGVDLEAMPRPADERLAEALAPLRTELDMIIQMLGRLSYRGIQLPAPCGVELEPTRIAWSSLQPRRPGDWLRVELYFNPTFREPVIVFGKVTKCAEDNGDDGFRIQADLAETSEDIGESVARLAFLARRRQQARRSAHTGARVHE